MGIEQRFYYKCFNATHFYSVLIFELEHYFPVPSIHDHQLQGKTLLILSCNLSNI